MTSRHVVHFGDLHLRWSEGRRREQLEARELLIRAIDDALEYEPALWIWPGDLNDGPMTIADRNFLAGQLQQMADVAPVVVVYGNHDRPGDLHIFHRIAAAHPIVVADAPRLVTCASIAVACLPYPSKGVLVAAGGTREETLANGGAALDTIIDGLARKLEHSDAEIKIVAGHINVAGSLASTGQPQIGRELEIPPALLDRFPPGVTVALNHIHKGQAVGRATYAGSMSRLSWGETESKRFLVYRYTWTRGNLYPDVETLEHPIDCPPMYHLEAGAEHSGVGYVEEQPRDVAPGARVRVRFGYCASDPRERERIGRLILADLTHAGEISLEPIAMPAGDIRAPEIASADTLEEKVRRWLREDEQPNGATRAGVCGKVLWLQQRHEDEILADVRGLIAQEIPTHGTT